MNFFDVDQTERRQLDLFTPSRLAKKPYCKEEKDGAMLIRPCTTALLFPLIQPNTPFAINRLVLDIDRDIRVTARGNYWFDDLVLPQPNWTAINPANGHGHASYEIASPVAIHDAARRKPMEFLAAIESGFIAKAHADPASSPRRMPTRPLQG